MDIVDGEADDNGLLLDCRTRVADEVEGETGAVRQDVVLPGLVAPAFLQAKDLFVPVGQFPVWAVNIGDVDAFDYADPPRAWGSRNSRL